MFAVVEVEVRILHLYDPGKKFKVSPSTRKMMLTVFRDMKSVLLAEFLPRGNTLNSATHCAALTKLQPAIRNKSSKTNQRIPLPHDNARPHVFGPVCEKL